MIKVNYASKYLSERKKFLKNNPKIVEKVIRTINKFVKNPSHPSLNLEKLSGSKVWTIRIDRRNRIFLTWINKNTTLFLAIGKHDKYRKF